MISTNGSNVHDPSQKQIYANHEKTYYPYFIDNQIVTAKFRIFFNIQKKSANRKPKAKYGIFIGFCDQKQPLTAINQPGNRRNLHFHPTRQMIETFGDWFTKTKSKRTEELRKPTSQPSASQNQHGNSTQKSSRFTGTPLYSHHCVSHKSIPLDSPLKKNRTILSTTIFSSPSPPYPLIQALQTSTFARFSPYPKTPLTTFSKSHLQPYPSRKKKSGQHPFKKDTARNV